MLFITSSVITSHYGEIFVFMFSKLCALFWCVVLSSHVSYLLDPAGQQ